MPVTQAEIEANDNGYVIIEGRRYPSLCPPGAHWATDEGWRILDTIKDGVIPDDVRAFLSGAIAGALMTARRAAEPARWQPIETAPKDGTYVLASTKSGHRVILQFCEDGFWRNSIMDTGWFQPTHWQPLPSPPESK